MTHRATRLRTSLIALALGATWLGAAWAAKPEDAGPGRGKDKPPAARAASAPASPAAVVQGSYFSAAQRKVIHDFYAPRVAAGKCPPGLAKKNNGCQPPGQAKKWALGARLPSDVITYPVPREIRERLGEPPPGYKFVRVAADILLIAIGTSMVIDAIEDLANL